MKFTKIALTLLCSTLLFCGCAKKSDVVLKINDKEITRAEFYNDFNKIKEIRLKDAPKEYQKDDSLLVLAIKERYVDDFVARELLKQEFEKRKIEATPEELQAKKDNIIKMLGSKEQFDNLMKENGIKEEQFNDDMKFEVQSDKLTGDPKISNSEIEKFYKENKAQFEQPERVLASHILIDTNPASIKRMIADADKEAKLSTADIDKKVSEEVARKEKLVKDLREQLVKDPKKFADLARQYSEDKASAVRGGDLGFIARDSVVKEFGDAAFTQKVGTISPVVKTQFGEHIIYVRDKAAKGVQPLSEVKEDLKAYLSQQKKFAQMQTILTGLKSNAKIEYLDETINPENIAKKLDEAQKKQMEQAQKSQASPSEGTPSVK